MEDPGSLNYEDLPDTLEDLPEADDWTIADRLLQSELSVRTYRELRFPRRSVSVEEAKHLIKCFGGTGYYCRDS